MNIGFDAKRAYHNNTGLGNYSRTLISSLAQYFPGNDYYLFNPTSSHRLFKPGQNNIHEILPGGFLSQRLSSVWRSKWVVKDLEKLQIQLYHGLSHEIPVGISRSNVRSVVTMHDIIVEKFPHQYKAIDQLIYKRKNEHACRNADKIIAISDQTKKDLEEVYPFAKDKIEVCYQSCDTAFFERIPDDIKASIRKNYELPDNYLLYVGSIIERKNLLNICKALHQLQPVIDIPLVVVGSGSSYKKKVQQYLHETKILHRVIFLNDTIAKKYFPFEQLLPALYQMASIFLYPSVYEGFGIPVLEALFSGTPVITSSLSCLPESGGPASYYVDPYKPEDIAEGIKAILHSSDLQNKMITEGLQYAQNFTPDKCAAEVMKVYQSLV